MNFDLKEDSLKKLIENQLDRDFLFIREAEGVFYADGKSHNVRIDYIVKAKDHLIRKGFPDKYFGIEVKHIKEDRVDAQLDDLFAQCLVYRKSIFQNRGIEPFSVLAFTNLNFKGNSPFLASLRFNSGSHMILRFNDEDYRFCQKRLRFIGRFNVGIFKSIIGDPYGLNYKIKIGDVGIVNRNGKFLKVASGIDRSLSSYTGSKRRYNPNKLA